MSTEIRALAKGAQSRERPADEPEEILAPGIVSDPGICGGDPIIAGTRIAVHDIVALAERYAWDMDLVHTEEFPHLSPEPFAAAVDWYRSHRAEIEEILRRRQAVYDRLWAQSQGSR